MCSNNKWSSFSSSVITFVVSKYIQIGPAQNFAVGQEIVHVLMDTQSTNS